MVPQLDVPWFVHVPAGSAPPTGTGEQVPAVAASAHERQLPVQVVAQQTPWAQMPLRHSPPVPQTAPIGLRPHEAALQVAGGAHSPSVAHDELQAAVPHPNGKQETAAGVTQTPAPSHRDPGVSVVMPAGQLAALHDVPWAYFWQLPASHLPSVPQDAAPWSVQAPTGSDPPLGTSTHVPIDPGIAHDLQLPLHAVAQQTPCAQVPEPHSGPPAQNAPIGLRPQELPLHTFPGEQFASAVQATKHLLPLQAKGGQGTASGATQAPAALHVASGV